MTDWTKRLIEEEQRSSAFRDAARGSIGTSAIDRAARGVIGSDTARQQFLDAAAGSVASIAATDLAETVRGIQALSVNDEMQRMLQTGSATEAMRLAMEANRNFPDIVSPGLFGTHSSQLSSTAIEYEKLFRHPGYDEAMGLARAAVEVRLFQQSEFTDRIAGLASNWAKVGEEMASVQAIARLDQFGSILTARSAFDEIVGETLRDGLGSWSGDFEFVSDAMLNPVVRASFYETKGFDRALTDFAPASFDEVLTATGLELDEELLGDESIEDAARAEQAFRVIRKLETRLRNFIASRLEAEFGSRWEKSQIPADMLKSWKEKRASDLERGRAARPRLIDYADFSDYLMIFEKRDNWERAFKPFFQRKTDIQESLLRLAPVRIVTSHAALVTQDDELLLLIESRRILGAIRSGLR